VIGLVAVEVGDFVSPRHERAQEGRLPRLQYRHPGMTFHDRTAAQEPEFRRGPRSQIALLEKALRKRHLLGDDDRIIEWRQGRIVRLRINGLDQAILSLRGRQAPARGGMSSLSYSARSLFCIGRRMRAADLARVHRLEGIGHDSLCVIYSAAPSRILSVQWRTGEPGEHDAELAALITRIWDQRHRRLSELSSHERERVERERADLEDFGLIEAEFARISAPADGRRGRSGREGALPGPASVIGRWLRALIVRDTDALPGLLARLNDGKPGWNRDEAGVMQAACDLAVARYFGASYDANAVAEFVSSLHRIEQAGGTARHGKREMEAVVRHALADSDIDVSGINAQVAYEIQGRATVFVAWQLAWPPLMIDALLAKAEQIALGRGLRPPPATG
jgi:hypothetical protein